MLHIRGSILLLASCLLSCGGGERPSEAAVPHDPVYRDRCLIDFEQSDFVPQGGDDLRPWWLAGNLGEISSAVGPGEPAFVVVEGRLSEPGGFGHLCAYGRQLTVTRVLEVRPIEAERPGEPPPAPR